MHENLCFPLAFTLSSSSVPPVTSTCHTLKMIVPSWIPKSISFSDDSAPYEPRQMFALSENTAILKVSSSNGMPEIIKITRVRVSCFLSSWQLKPRWSLGASSPSLLRVWQLPSAGLWHNSVKNYLSGDERHMEILAFWVLYLNLKSQRWDLMVCTYVNCKRETTVFMTVATTGFIEPRKKKVSFKSLLLLWQSDIIATIKRFGHFLK